jgi:hypothetical protein
MPIDDLFGIYHLPSDKWSNPEAMSRSGVASFHEEMGLGDIVFKSEMTEQVFLRSFAGRVV